MVMRGVLWLVSSGPMSLMDIDRFHANQSEGAEPERLIFSWACGMGLGPAKFFVLLLLFVLGFAFCSTNSIRDARRPCHTRKGSSGGHYSRIPQKEKSNGGGW